MLTRWLRKVREFFGGADMVATERPAPLGVAGGCLRCHQSWPIVKDHSTPYCSCTEESMRAYYESLRPVMAGEPFTIPPEIRGKAAIRAYMNDGHCSGCSTLCENCWAVMTPQQRLPYYERLLDLWERLSPERDFKETRQEILDNVLAGM